MSVPPGTSLDSLAGRDFGPYRLVRRLGVGGMAETYEAIRRGPSGFSQHVCLKLVLPFFRDNEDFVELFQREARLAAKLRHSNIVGVIDFGEYEGVPYMALELIDGADLRALLDAQGGKRLPPELVALLAVQLAAALEHAHSPQRGKGDRGSTVTAIIHRDISPSNVLISRHGEIFLSDFGVAKAISGTSHKQSAVKGKVPYMSPEQLRAEPLDGRSDLFALGVVLFEALSGRRPYEGAHDPATIMLTLAGDHPGLRGLAPNAPPALCDVIERLIEPDRDARPENAAALIDLLDEFVPSPRARRKLGEMIEECRPAVPRIITEEALGEATEASGPPGTEATTGVHRTGSGSDSAAATLELDGSRPYPASPKRNSGRRLAGALLLIGALAAGAFAFWNPQGADDPGSSAHEAPSAVETGAEAREPSESPSTRAAESVETAKAPIEDTAEVESSAAAKEPAPPDVAPRRPALLTVIVFPWGNVWINGKRRGPAPLKNESLKPGRYKISVGQEAPFESQTIRLRAGQRRSLSFDLTK